MNKILVAVFLVALVVGVNCDDDKKEGGDQKGRHKYFAECCKEKFGTEDKKECGEKLKTKDENSRCFAKCILEKKGIIKNGEFIKDGEEVAQGKEKTKEKINHCLNKKEGEGDICEQAQRVMGCLLHKGGGKGGKHGLAKMFKECCKEKFSTEDLKECVEKRKTKDENSRCFVKCLLEKSGIIKNGEFIKDGEEVAHGKEKVKEKVNECLKKKEGEGDICDQAARVAQCLFPGRGEKDNKEKKKEEDEAKD